MRTLTRFVVTSAFGAGLLAAGAGMAAAAPELPAVPGVPGASAPEAPQLPDPGNAEVPYCMEAALTAAISDPAAAIAGIAEDPENSVESDLTCVESALPPLPEAP